MQKAKITSTCHLVSFRILIRQTWPFRTLVFIISDQRSAKKGLIRKQKQTITSQMAKTPLLTVYTAPLLSDDAKK